MKSIKFNQHLMIGCLLAAPAPTMLATAAMAQTAVAPAPVTAVDVAAKPLDDLNLRKVQIGPALEAALAHPYAVPGKGRCASLNHDVADLDAALGPDVDAGVSPSGREKRDRTIGSTARSLVGSLIPFNGVIRQISGANAEENRRARYIYAGSVRRAFLKGFAKARGCQIRRAT